MTIIKIDDKEYDSSQISKEAKDQFDSLRFVEAELQRLQLLPVQQLSIIHSRHLQKQVSTL